MVTLILQGIYSVVRVRFLVHGRVPCLSGHPRTVTEGRKSEGGREVRESEVVSGLQTKETENTGTTTVV